MPPRNHKKWLEKPKVDFVSSLIYSDHGLYEQELENIFSKVWIPICHESELPNTGCFRTSSIANQNVIAVHRQSGIEVYKNDGIRAVSGLSLYTSPSPRD